MEKQDGREMREKRGRRKYKREEAVTKEALENLQCFDSAG